MPYDVFVSYPHVDRGWVEESIARPLAGALKGDGSRARVFFDTYSIRGGSDWRATIDSEIRAAARFVPVWTKAYWESPICRQELETAMSCDPSQKRRFVVPVWDGNAEIPGALARLQAHRTDLRNFLELLMRDLDLRSSTGGDGIEWLFESIQGWDRDRGGRKLFRIARENAGNLSDIGRLAGHRDGVQGLACGPEPNLLVSAGMEDHRNWKSSVAIWEANTGRLTRSIACEHSGRVALSADGSTSLVAGYNLCSQVDLRSGREVRQLLGPCAAIFPNGQQAVTGTLNGMVVCYDLRSGEAKVVTLDEVAANDHNLNIPLYVEPVVDEETVTVEQALASLKKAYAEACEAEDKLAGLLEKEGLMR